MMDIDETLKERGNRYGEFSTHALVTQKMKDLLRMGPSWGRMNASQREAADMIAHKLGRIVNGDPNYADSWVDIVGYTKLVIDELEEVEKPPY